MKLRTFIDEMREGLEQFQEEYQSPKDDVSFANWREELDYYLSNSGIRSSSGSRTYYPNRLYIATRKGY